MTRLFLAILLALAACSPVDTVERAETTVLEPEIRLPAMKQFNARRGRPTNASNGQIAQDFLELSFQMESGRRLPFLTKFDGPIKVSVQPGAPSGLERELNQLLGRLRSEANIPISRANAGETGQIVVQAIPRRTLQRAVPNAACFVVPNVAGWTDFKRSRGRGKTDWANIDRRTRATVIIPSDVSPQEVRDCLHEEIAQALGPLNDLYRLHDSIFNDDNFHTVLTGYDMLILRAYYSRELVNGMTRAQVAQVLPSVLARINPNGRKLSGSIVAETPTVWRRSISSALSNRTTDNRRTRFARDAVDIANREGWSDNRLAFSLYVHGRTSVGSDNETALKSFLQAGDIFRSRYGNSVHTAHIATQMAAFALSGRRNDLAVRIIDDAIPAARTSQNAALLATLLMMKAEAFDAIGRVNEARAIRREALGWGRYGFGKDQNVVSRLREIQALMPSDATERDS